MFQCFRTFQFQSFQYSDLTLLWIKPFYTKKYRIFFKNWFPFLIKLRTDDGITTLQSTLVHIFSSDPFLVPDNLSYYSGLAKEYPSITSYMLEFSTKLYLITPKKIALVNFTSFKHFSKMDPFTKYR